jgi:hypothetical protein
MGVSLLSHRIVKLGLTLSIGWSLGVWCFGEGLGELLTGTASPLTGAPGAALLYVLASLILWPAGRAYGRTAASQGVLGETWTRLAWAVLWFTFAALWLSSANTTRGSVEHAIASAPAGAHWLGALERWAGDAAAGHGLGIAVALAIVSAAVGLGVLLGRATRLLLATAALLAIGYWIVGEGLGGILTGQATDPNTGPLLVLMAASLYPIARPPDGPASPQVALARAAQAEGPVTVGSAGEPLAPSAPSADKFAVPDLSSFHE